MPEVKFYVKINKGGNPQFSKGASVVNLSDSGSLVARLSDGTGLPTLADIVAAMRTRTSKRIKVTAATGGQPQKLRVFYHPENEPDEESYLWKGTKIVGTAVATGVVLWGTAGVAAPVLVGGGMTVGKVGYGAYSENKEAVTKYAETPCKLRISSRIGKRKPVMELPNTEYTFPQLADQIEAKLGPSGFLKQLVKGGGMELVGMGIGNVVEGAVLGTNVGLTEAVAKGAGDVVGDVTGNMLEAGGKWLMSWWG